MDIIDFRNNLHDPHQIWSIDISCDKKWLKIVSSSVFIIGSNY